MGRGYYDVLRPILLRHGCVFVRQGKGSHEIWQSPLTGRGTKFAEVLEAMGYTGTTYRGEDKQLYRAGFGAFGLKLRGEKAADLAAAKQRKTAYEVREIRADMGRIRRDKTLSDDAREAKLAKRQAVLERLMGGE